MSVKRTVRGSVSGNFSDRAIAMSSTLSQSSVGGMFSQYFLVVCFFRVILVPVGNFHDDVRRAIGHRLAAKARLWRNARRFVELVKLGVGRFVTGLKSLAHDHMANRARAHSAASVV